MKIVTIVGARPQFIKAAPVSRAIKSYDQENHSHKITEILIHTGQHYDHNMSQIFFDQLGIHRPQYNLGVGSVSSLSVTHGTLAK
ncbi:UDP-2,3-diacetamido-2,3-dideoxy-D-glucuronate 2-epimerase [subsurface metagenome]